MHASFPYTRIIQLMAHASKMIAMSNQCLITWSIEMNLRNFKRYHGVYSRLGDLKCLVFLTLPLKANTLQCDSLTRMLAFIILDFGYWTLFGIKISCIATDTIIKKIEIFSHNQILYTTARPQSKVYRNFASQLGALKCKFTLR